MKATVIVMAILRWVSCLTLVFGGVLISTVYRNTEGGPVAGLAIGIIGVILTVIFGLVEMHYERKLKGVNYEHY